MFWPRFFKTRFFWGKCVGPNFFNKNNDNDNKKHINSNGLDTIEINLVT